jgi:hypothetical protein
VDHALAFDQRGRAIRTTKFRSACRWQSRSMRPALRLPCHPDSSRFTARHRRAVRCQPAWPSTRSAPAYRTLSAGNVPSIDQDRARPGKALLSASRSGLQPRLSASAPGWQLPSERLQPLPARRPGSGVPARSAGQHHRPSPSDCGASPCDLQTRAPPVTERLPAFPRAWRYR